VSTNQSPERVPRRQFGGLNGIRAFGAFCVLTTHVGFHSGAALNSTFNGLLSRLDVGVAIFYVISGFLLFRPHAEAWVLGGSAPATRRYLWHRVLRIFPALWLAIIAAALLLEPPDPAVPVYLRHASLTQIYTTGNAAQGLTQMWSLATEMAFYLVLPALGWALTRGAPTRRAARARVAILIGSCAAGAAWMAMTATHHAGQLALWLPGYVGWFGMGMALALWRVARGSGIFPRSWVDEAARHPGTLWGLAAALYLVLISPVAGPYSLVQASPGQAAVKSVLYAALATLVVLPTVAARTGAADPPAVRRLAGRTGTFLGDISYGVFCYHLIVLGVVEQILGYTIFTGGFLRLLVPTLVGSVAVATVSYYTVERPVMRWGRKGERRDPLPVGPVAPTGADTQTATAIRTSS
jgi:peptidoglycan/LPS O-acetylase OafA/YrhL